MRYRRRAPREIPNNITRSENEYPVKRTWPVAIEELPIEGRHGGLIVQSRSRAPVVVDEQPVSVVLRETRSSEPAGLSSRKIVHRFDPVALSRVARVGTGRNPPSRDIHYFLRGTSFLPGAIPGHIPEIFYPLAFREDVDPGFVRGNRFYDFDARAPGCGRKDKIGPVSGENGKRVVEQVALGDRCEKTAGHPGFAVRCSSAARSGRHLHIICVQLTDEVLGR